MARRPYFSGNYGSALGSTANAANIIARAGETQGRMFQQMGQQIGGMIQQYGLNKEKQKKADARIKSALNGMPEFVEAGILTPEAKTRAEEFLNNPNISSAEKVEFLNEEEKRRVELPKLQLMQSQNTIAGLEAELKEATQTNEITMSALSTESKRLMNESMRLTNAISTAKSENIRDQLRKEQKVLDGQIAQLKEQTRGIKGKNDIFDLTKEDLVLQNKLKTSEIMSELVINANQVKKLQREIELLGVTDNLEREKLQAQIDNLKADAKNKLAEAEVFMEESRKLKAFTTAATGNEESASSLFQLGSIEEGAQGDITGQFKSFANAVGDYFTLGTPFEESRDAKAQVKQLRNSLLPAFIESFSEKGSEWAKNLADEILPNENMGDGEFRATIRELPNKLQEKMETDRIALDMKKGTESEQLRMLRNLREFPILISDLNRIIKQDDSTNQNLTDEELLKKYEGFAP